MPQIYPHLYIIGFEGSPAGLECFSPVECNCVFPIVEDISNNTFFRFTHSPSLENDEYEIEILPEKDMATSDATVDQTYDENAEEVIYEGVAAIEFLDKQWHPLPTRYSQADINQLLRQRQITPIPHPIPAFEDAFVIYVSNTFLEAGPIHNGHPKLGTELKWQQLDEDYKDYWAICTTQDKARTLLNGWSDILRRNAEKLLRSALQSQFSFEESELKEMENLSNLARQAAQDDAQIQNALLAIGLVWHLSKPGTLKLFYERIIKHEYDRLSWYGFLDRLDCYQESLRLKYSHSDKIRYLESQDQLNSEEEAILNRFVEWMCKATALSIPLNKATFNKFQKQASLEKPMGKRTFSDQLWTEVCNGLIEDEAFTPFISLDKKIGWFIDKLTLEATIKSGKLKKDNLGPYARCFVVGAEKIIRSSQVGNPSQKEVAE